MFLQILEYFVGFLKKKKKKKKKKTEKRKVTKISKNKWHFNFFYLVKTKSQSATDL